VNITNDEQFPRELLVHLCDLRINKDNTRQIQHFRQLSKVHGVPPGHEPLSIGRIKLHSSMTFI
jgi:hypothetical protein